MSKVSLLPQFVASTTFRFRAQYWKQRSNFLRLGCQVSTLTLFFSLIPNYWRYSAWKYTEFWAHRIALGLLCTHVVGLTTACKWPVHVPDSSQSSWCRSLHWRSLYATCCSSNDIQNYDCLRAEISRHQRGVSVNISQSASKSVVVTCTLIARLTNTLLKDEKSARDNLVLACNFAIYSPILFFSLADSAINLS